MPFVPSYAASLFLLLLKKYFNVLPERQLNKYMSRKSAYQMFLYALPNILQYYALGTGLDTVN